MNGNDDPNGAGNDDDFDLSDPVNRAAVQQVLDDLRSSMDGADAAEPHALLVTDPQTDTRHVIGVFPDRLHARIAAIIERARSVRADLDLADLVYEPVMFIDTDLRIDPRQLREEVERRS